MHCPLDANAGFIELIGPIQQADLNNIKVKSNPLSITISPKITPPPMSKNKILESTDNFCRYKGDRFNLVDVQICSVTNKGYILPTTRIDPVAELIIAFKPNSKTTLSGILLCVPIYDSGNPSHDAYLNQFITPSDPSDKNVNAPTLESIFYSGDTQTSFAYTTCFETTTSNSLYIFVFPNGIHLTQSGFQTLKTMVAGNETFPPYMIPVDIRNAEPTVRSFTFDKNGNKIPTITSKDGIIYSTPISSCTDDFKYRFEYFTDAPKLSSSKKASTDQCEYSTTQYKCVPLKQLKDPNICLNKGETLQHYIDKQNKSIKTDTNVSNVSDPNVSNSNSVTTVQIENIIGDVLGVILVTGIFLKLGHWISKHY
jgi:hypothetical protein